MTDNITEDQQKKQAETTRIRKEYAKKPFVVAANVIHRSKSGDTTMKLQVGRVKNEKEYAKYVDRIVHTLRVVLKKYEGEAVYRDKYTNALPIRAWRKDTGLVEEVVLGFSLHHVKNWLSLDNNGKEGA